MSGFTQVAGFDGRVLRGRSDWWFSSHYIVESFCRHEIYLTKLPAREEVLASLQKIRELEASAFQRADRLDRIQNGLAIFSCALLPVTCCISCYCGTCTPCYSERNYPETKVDMYLRVCDPCFTCGLYDVQKRIQPWYAGQYYLTSDERSELETAEKTLRSKEPIPWRQQFLVLEWQETTGALMERGVAPIDLEMRQRDLQNQIAKLEQTANWRKTALCIASNVFCPCSALGSMCFHSGSPPNNWIDLVSFACVPCETSERSLRAEKWLLPPERQEMQALKTEREQLKKIAPLDPLFQALDGQTPLVRHVLDYANLR